jgi:hypothetical protein
VSNTGAAGKSDQPLRPVVGFAPHVVECLARNPDQVKEEVEEHKGLVEHANPCRGCRVRSEAIATIRTAKAIEFFDNLLQRLLIFTEFKDTLDYLVKKLKEWSFTVGTIHGGMPTSSC